MNPLPTSPSGHTNCVRTFTWDVPVTAVLTLEMAQCYDSPPFISNGYWFDLFIKRDHYPLQSQRMSIWHNNNNNVGNDNGDNGNNNNTTTSHTNIANTNTANIRHRASGTPNNSTNSGGTTSTTISSTTNSTKQQQRDTKSCLGLYLEMLPNKSNLRMPFHLPKATWSIYCRSHVDNGSYRYLRSAEKCFHSEMRPGFGFGHPNLFGVTWDQICEDTFDYCVNGLFSFQIRLEWAQ